MLCLVNICLHMNLKISVKYTYSNGLNYLSNNIDISSMVDKHFKNICMSFMTCIMKGSPSILLKKQTNYQLLIRPLTHNNNIIKIHRHHKVPCVIIQHATLTFCLHVSHLYFHY